MIDKFVSWSSWEQRRSSIRQNKMRTGWFRSSSRAELMIIMIRCLDIDSPLSCDSDSLLFLLYYRFPSFSCLVMIPVLVDSVSKKDRIRVWGIFCEEMLMGR